MSPVRPRTSTRWHRLEGLFEHARGLTRPERDELLQRVATSEDPALAAEAAALLDADDRAAGFLAAEPPLEPPVADDPAVEAPELGWRLGAYRLERLLGEGGTSRVYLASRSDRAYEGRVAIKVLKRGLDTDDLLARFRSERQILASLDHPNIARLFDGGSTPDGRPFFVMEAIEGTPIDRFCNRNELSLERRIALFARVCDAVDAAHRSLVVHRDIKPGNILVTAGGAPKLVDFGIAKLLDPERFALTQAKTEAGRRLLTPRYASPEQLAGGALTTATDVFSLGLVLYELLAGRLPPPRNRGGLPAAGDTALPAQPSNLALAGCGLSQRRLRRRLAGDLDRIVLTAVHPVSQRRYATAEHLGDDLRRCLAGQPVKARGDGLAYRTGKLLRRHAAAAAAAFVALLLLIVFALVSARQSVVAAQERDRAQAARGEAERQRDRAQAVTGLLVDLFRGADPAQLGGPEISAREVLDRGAATLDRELAGQPVLRAAMLRTMGDVYRNLGLYDRARPLLERALALQRQAAPDDGEALAGALISLAALIERTGDHDRADELYRQALDHLGADAETAVRVRALIGRATNLYYAGDYDAAEPLLTEALARAPASAAASRETARALNMLAGLHDERGDLAGAEALGRRAVELWRGALGDDHPELAMGLNNLAVLLTQRGETGEAQVLFREALAIRRRVFGDAHPEVAASLLGLGQAIAAGGDAAGAAPLLERALTGYRRALGDEHVEVARTLHALAEVRRATGDVEGAITLWREAYEMGLRLFPAGHPGLAYPLLAIGGAEMERGRPAAAEPVLRQAYALLRQHLDPGSPRRLAAAGALAACLEALERSGEARRLRAAEGEGPAGRGEGPARPPPATARPGSGSPR